MGGSFDSSIAKSMYSHFCILSTAFWCSSGIPSATMIEDEQGGSLAEPPGNLSCFSPSASSTRVDVTTDTSVEDEPKLAIAYFSCESRKYIM